MSAKVNTSVVTDNAQAAIYVPFAAATAIETADALRKKTAYYAQQKAEKGISALFRSTAEGEECLVKPPVYRDENGKEKEIQSRRILAVLTELSVRFGMLEGESLRVAVSAATYLATCWQEWERCVAKLHKSGKQFAESSNLLAGTVASMEKAQEAANLPK